MSGDLTQLELAREILLEYLGIDVEPKIIVFHDPLGAEIVCVDGSRHHVNGLFAARLHGAREQ